MLQVDHVYEFLYQEIFKNFIIWHLPNGVPKSNNNISLADVLVFTHSPDTHRKILFYDQEPVLPSLIQPYMDIFNSDDMIKILVTSEISADVDTINEQNNLYSLYYFFHGFAALDWYRGYYALNYNKSVIKPYKYDFISFNRLLTNDRSYRLYFVSLLMKENLANKGLISFNVTDDSSDWTTELLDPNTKLSNKVIPTINIHAPRER